MPNTNVSFNSKSRLLFSLPVKVYCKVTIGVPCVTVLRDTKPSSDSADKKDFYARRESADEGFSLELIADM